MPLSPPPKRERVHSFPAWDESGFRINICVNFLKKNGGEGGIRTNIIPCYCWISWNLLNIY